MPTVHTMGKDGWDLAAAVEKVRARAAARGDDEVVGGCGCILRAVKEVDEGDIPTVAGDLYTPSNHSLSFRRLVHSVQ